MISPIAEKLATVAESGPKAEAESKNQPEAAPDTAQALASANDDGAEHSSFFQSPGHIVDIEPESLPGQLQNSASQIPAQLKSNPIFEHLRQSILRERSREFVKLTPREQALAKLGGAIYTNRQSFDKRVYHFSQNNVLIAVLDRARRRFYMRREIADMDYSEIYHLARPDTGGANSTDFDAIPVLDAVWAYAQHDAEAMLDLPPEFGASLFQLRQLPAISPNLMTDHHMQVIRKLLTRQLRFAQLRELMPQIQASVLVSDLVCLYLTRSLVLAS
ncbi:hypothetical protein [Variovorax sp. PCZ-1]|uniref:hypothetical protein n=1 Tax=Variovorax sp. PCZ-1 TaxID=2835533 RepID=UPI001BD056AF|nr:hypothetical protein [Variovorax sp. PCZ-1]MBS7807365.1 hypothetical protein [Variovorax sp. PCZ-1]